MWNFTVSRNCKGEDDDAKETDLILSFNSGIINNRDSSDEVFCCFEISNAMETHREAKYLCWSNKPTNDIKSSVNRSSLVVTSPIVSQSLFCFYSLIVMLLHL